MDTFVIFLCVGGLVTAGAWVTVRLRNTTRRLSAEERAFSSEVLAQYGAAGMRGEPSMNHTGAVRHEVRSGKPADASLNSESGFRSRPAHHTPVIARMEAAGLRSESAPEPVKPHEAQLPKDKIADSAFRDSVLRRLEAGQLLDVVEGPLRGPGATPLGVTARLKDGRRIGVCDRPWNPASAAESTVLRHLDGLIVQAANGRMSGDAAAGGDLNGEGASAVDSEAEPIFIRRFADVLSDSIRL